MRLGAVTLSSLAPGCVLSKPSESLTSPGTLNQVQPPRAEEWAPLWVAKERHLGCFA